MSEIKITIVGGGIAGLMAAKEAEKHFDDIVLYEEGNYEGERRGPWGEMIWDYSMMNLERDIPGYVREVDTGIFEYDGDKTEVSVNDGVIINRGELEKYLAGTLEKTEIEADTHVEENMFSSLAEESNLLIDASGPFPVSNYFNDLSYETVLPTISGRLKGDFSDMYPEPRAVGYKNYFVWIVPQTQKKATVGIGCSPKNDPEELYSDLEEIMDEHDIEVPEKKELHRGVDVCNSTENLKNCSYKLNSCTVMVVGSAAGLNNVNTGFGLTHAARSARTAIKSFNEGSSYTENLISANKHRLRSQGPILQLQKRLGGLKSISGLAQSNLEYDSIFEPETTREVIVNTKNFIPRFSSSD